MKLKNSKLYLILLFYAFPSWAEGTSPQPYIDEVKKKISEARDESPPSENYTKEIKIKLGENSSSEGYTQKMKQELEKSKEEKSFIESEKLKLPPLETRSVIADIQSGHSELKFKKPQEIRAAIAVKLGVSAQRNITADSSPRIFNEIYGNKWTPDLNFSYEYQPFHSEWFGNIGLVFSTGLSFNEGNGIFKIPLVNNKTGQSFGAESQTRFRFFIFPLAAGFNYRFNLMRILRPYIQVEGAVIGFVESRSDDRKNKRGFSKAVYMSGGINLLLDWFSSSLDWDLYEEAGVKHSYLTFDFTRVSSFASPVKFAVNTYSLGLTYEY